MDIIIRIPSKVPYGYIEVRADETEIDKVPSPEMLASFYANYMKAYKDAEVKALEAPPTAPPAIPTPTPEEAAAKLNAMDKLITEELGGKIVGAKEKPWENEVETPEKPWESDGAKASEPSTSDDDWDF